jgi:membrane protein required for colicin V production
MNAVDVGILVVIGIFAVLGLRRGFLLGFVDLVAFGLAVIVAARAAEAAAAPLRAWGLPASLAAGIGFVVTLVVGLFVLGLATGVLLAPLGAFGAGTPLGWVNSGLGLIPGIVRGLAASALLIMIVMAAPQEFGLRPQLAASRLAPSIVKNGSKALLAGLDWAGIDPSLLGGFVPALTD